MSHQQLPEFQQHQHNFASNIRDPQTNPVPGGIEQRRMKIYQELFYNNVAGFISSGFPVIKEILSEEYWHAMVRDFFIRHQCETPLFAEISEEFVNYLEEQRNAASDPPFLLELAHYEWVELALSVSDADRNLPGYNPNGNLAEGIPLASPLAWTLSYQYPVHRISSDFQPSEPGEQPTLLTVYRDRLDEIHFLEINPVTFRLLQLIGENETKTGKELLQTIAEEMQHPNPQAVIEHGRSLLDDLRNRNIVIGTRN